MCFTSDLIYVRNKDKNNKENTIIPIAIKPYRLQIDDVLNINIKALGQSNVSIKICRYSIGHWGRVNRAKNWSELCFSYNLKWIFCLSDMLSRYYIVLLVCFLL